MKKQIIFLLFIVFLMSSGASQGGAVDPVNAESNAGEMLRDAVITTSLFSHIHQDLVFGFSYIGVDGTASAPLNVFDALHGHGVNRSLAQLASFYLGEAPDEDYECIVQRKGPSIVSALKEELGKSPTFCATFIRKLQHVKQIEGELSLVPKNLCLSEDETRRKITHLISLIETKTSCSIEK
jgi:hypothetical protein